ncbi:kinesin-like protein NACK2 isoform X1 [Bidens hawaiensis]|uniref:kinesin-like protein NACK2 isoform X1 n=1 Tax=Bidens hawaiensis TaxID=980011 RepID=UPI00404ADD4A
MTYMHILTMFVLKFSAIEIYNETVVDLLNRDSGALRLLDDPEKGTIVEKLSEEVIKDSMHLRCLIATCEDQRQVGETSLNDRSSRSHQIIRLTIESSLQDESGRVKSLLASLSLVDLAGSERASQTNVAGARLKEGSHINKSLLTLTNVIRKLSSGKKTGHIPYRDSKLTRILQSSLGGNARTAIICTMSPALSHVDQSRNTLAFATSAKEVTNTAKINMVVDEKQLTRNLQKEVNRLKAKMLSPEPSSCDRLKSLLLEKEQKIQQMEREMDEVKRERDLALSQLEVSKLQEPSSRQPAKRLSFGNENVERKTQRRGRQSIEQCMLVHEIRKIGMMQKRFGEEANRTLELLSSHRVENDQSIVKLVSDIKSMTASLKDDISDKEGGGGSLKEEIGRLKCEEIASLEEKLEYVQKSLYRLVSSGEEDSRTPLKNKKRNNNNNIPNFIRSPCLPNLQGTENRDPETYNSPATSSVVTPNQKQATPADDKKITPKSASKQPQGSVNVKKIQMMFKTAAEDNIQSIKAYVTDLKERVAKLQYQKQLLVCQVLELEEEHNDDKTEDLGEQSPMPRHLAFEDHRKQIIMLWHLCHVSVIHRTQFYMLFRGEPADDIYIQVELRRLTWLEQQLSDLGNASPALLGDEPAGYVTSSIKALKQEREYLAKRVSMKLSAEEREMLYRKWDVPMEGGKQRRRLQLVNRLWTDPLNMSHVKESAELVAKLVGFCESGSKEMFALNFVNPSDQKSWMGGWNMISNLLHL